MFCSHCGKADQEKNTYCRQCGEFLPDTGATRRSGQPITPDEQIKMSLVFNLLSAVVGFGVGALVLISHLNRDGTHFSVFLAMSFLFVIGAWQTFSFFNNLKLRKRFAREKNDIIVSEQVIEKNPVESAKTKDLLPEADLSNVVPASVTERTTKNLKEKVERSSKPEQ